jgi:membrane protease subunit HflC
MRRLALSLLVLAALGVLAVWGGEVGVGPVVINHEDEQKIILLFGDPVSIRTEPGALLRLPLVMDVLAFDRRWLYLNTEPLPIQTRDEERIVVDNYVVWRITDPLQFYASFPGGQEQAELQIDRIIRADVRKVIGQHTLAEVVSDARVEIMKKITAETDQGVREYGVSVRDVRINRTELPSSAEQNVYARMRTDRQRLARKYRAEGDEEGRKIRAGADREARVTVAEARRDAEIVRGEGEAEAARIYAEAHTTAPDFYDFVRRLEAYRKTIGPETTLLLPPDNEFFRLFATSREDRP